MGAPRQRRLQHIRLIAVAAGIAGLGLVCVLALQGGGAPSRASRTTLPEHRAAATAKTLKVAPRASVRRRRSVAARRTTMKPLRAQQHISVVVRERVLHFVDPERTMLVAGRTARREFDAVIRYPVGLAGPFPLIVFGHGFAVSPAPYAALLDHWARSGYVVVAPIFPLENANAPGGPDEHDLINQPGDITLVISSLWPPAAVPNGSAVSALIDFSRVAVAGQSDGGDTALAAAYGPDRDPRITAAMILSGAEDPFASTFRMPSNGPPLLAIQGTADNINPPWQTYQFFDQAAPPKYLLKLYGAGHQPPYTEAGTELASVEAVTVGFLDKYLKGSGAWLAEYMRAGAVGPDTGLTGES